jgi:hypothetical protein
MIRNVLVFLFASLVTFVFVVLYAFKGNAGFHLINVLAWLGGLSGLLAFLSLCASVFVGESTRRRRFGLMIFGLGSFGFWMSLAEWLKPSEIMSCEGLRRWRLLFCTTIESLPVGLQNPVGFVGLLLVLWLSLWLARMGWRIYRD